MECVCSCSALVFSECLHTVCVSPQSEVTSPSDAEDRTPGRLQAIWPPPKEDGEEKVGLRYTEAGERGCLLFSSTPSYLI